MNRCGQVQQTCAHHQTSACTGTTCEETGQAEKLKMLVMQNRL